MSKRSALDDCSAARCRATETSAAQSEHPCRKGRAAALARSTNFCKEALRRTAVQCGSPAGDRNTRGAVRATKTSAVQSGCPSPIGRMAALATVWAPTTAWRSALCRWATETSATQSGRPKPPQCNPGTPPLLQTGGSPDGMQSFWPCPFRKKGDARTALRRSRSPGLHCGCFGRPPTNRIVPQSSWALPECLTGQHFSILLLLFCDNLTPPKSQRQSALRQAVVGAQTVATSTTARRNGGLRGGQS